MKFIKYKAIFLLTCTSLFPLLALNLLINEHYSSQDAKVLPLLTALLVTLGLKLLVPHSERISPIFPHSTHNIPPIPSIGIIGQGEGTFFSFLKTLTSILTMGVVLTMVFQVNSWLSLTLLGLVPLDILCRKYLYRELIWLSSQSFPAFHELAAAQKYQHLVAVAPESHAPARGRMQQYWGILARAVIILLLLIDLILNDCYPIAVLYAIILPLYHFNLREIVYGNLTKGDLVNSINYLQHVQGNESSVPIIR